MKKISAAAAELGRKGGSSISEAKQIAARENGKKGGRPKAEKTIQSAVREARRMYHSKDAQITQALKNLGVDQEKAHNFGLANFDAKSVTYAVTRFFAIK